MTLSIDQPGGVTTTFLNIHRRRVALAAGCTDASSDDASTEAEHFIAQEGIEEVLSRIELVSNLEEVIEVLAERPGRCGGEIGRTAARVARNTERAQARGLASGATGLAHLTR